MIATKNETLLRLPQVLERIQLKRTAWLMLVKDGTAPQPVKIGRATFWPESEISQFIDLAMRREQRPAPTARPKQHKAATASPALAQTATQIMAAIVSQRENWAPGTDGQKLASIACDYAEALHAELRQRA